MATAHERLRQEVEQLKGQLKQVNLNLNELKVELGSQMMLTQSIRNVLAIHEIVLMKKKITTLDELKEIMEEATNESKEEESE